VTSQEHDSVVCAVALNSNGSQLATVSFVCVWRVWWRVLMFL
jgi:hypothetical protein